MRPKKRQERNARSRRNYMAAEEVTGPLVNPSSAEQAVRFRAAGPAGRPALAVLTILIACNLVLDITFLAWLLAPSHVPGPGLVGYGNLAVALARVGFICAVGIEVFRVAQHVTVWLFAVNARDPVPMTPPRGLRVAVLTTIVPDKEPIELVERTLRGMTELVYDGRVDVWILDEGDDPAVKAVAARLGVRHFSRKGQERYNTPVGPFKARTKAGNYNAWRDKHGRDYDVICGFDPDHVPRPSFLHRTLGYFRDPDVAFVVTPQIYGNMYDNFVAHGACGQQWLFNGVIQRGGNGMGVPLFTGTNNLCRSEALDQIGGIQTSIVEDHLTSVHLHAAMNTRTGGAWKGVYTPDILAIGEGPTSWADYFNQQKRWAQGVAEIVLDRSLWPRGRMRLRQRIGYGLLQAYYPGAAAIWLLGSAALLIYLLTGITSVGINPLPWVMLWGGAALSSMCLLLWLRRFNIAQHETREWGVPGMLLALFSGPVYAAAAIGALSRRPLSFRVTAKGSLSSAESVRTFRLHIVWAALASIVFGAGLIWRDAYPAQRLWAGFIIVGAAAPPLIAVATRITSTLAERHSLTSASVPPPASAPLPVSVPPRVSPSMSVSVSVPPPASPSVSASTVTSTSESDTWRWRRRIAATLAARYGSVRRSPVTSSPSSPPGG